LREPQETATVPKTARLTIRRWGNSLAVRIPAGVARSARFAVGQEVEIAVEAEGLTVKPVGPPRLTLAQKLEQFDPAKHGGEAMAADLVGAEII
jgi:antitoxin MazE